jgi:hypothetical protein
VETYTELCVGSIRRPPRDDALGMGRAPYGTCDPHTWLATQVDHTPRHLLTWFVRRGRLAVTFEETRAQLGRETQRQWSDIALARMTPVVLGLCLIVTVLADRLSARPALPVKISPGLLLCTAGEYDAVELLHTTP